MKQELNFFINRIGFKVYRESKTLHTGPIIITNAAHAQQLHDMQYSNGDVFTIAGTIKMSDRLLSLFFDGRTPKIRDYAEVLDRVRHSKLTLTNPEVLPEFYRNMYNNILAERQPKN